MLTAKSQGDASLSKFFRLKDFFKGFGWVHFVSRRFSRVDRKGSSAITTRLASLGICFGVMTLITVISVMNGFQRSFIDAILEVSSYHIRISNLNNLEDENLPEIEKKSENWKNSGNGKNSKNENLLRLNSFLENEKSVVSFFPFYEAESLVLGRNGNETAALIRAVSPEIYETDSGFKRELEILGGNFDISSPDTIVIGSEMARKLGARLGSKINLYALSGGNDVDLFSSDRIFTVTGIFHTGYAEINAAYAFVSLESGEKYFGKNAALTYGIKITNPDSSARIAAKIRKNFPELEVQPWREYNSSFFGALRVEKNMLMLLVFLIFVVVAINIFNGMRRMVYERKEEISVLNAFGAKPSKIQSIFVMQGFLTGVYGAVPGLILGLFLSVNMKNIFKVLSKITYFFNLFFAMIFSPETADFVRENTMFRVYSNIPPRIFLGEVLLITVFGIFSSLLASLAASRSVLKLSVAEVMRDE